MIASTRGKPQNKHGPWQAAQNLSQEEDGRCRWIHQVTDARDGEKFPGGAASVANQTGYQGRRMPVFLPSPGTQAETRHLMRYKGFVRHGVNGAAIVT
jgi:hypothetical protein